MRSAQIGTVQSVSYTHLDVYKRQYSVKKRLISILIFWLKMKNNNASFYRILSNPDYSYYYTQQISDCNRFVVEVAFRAVEVLKCQKSTL